MLYTQIGVCVTVCGCGCVKLQKYYDKKPSTIHVMMCTIIFTYLPSIFAYSIIKYVRTF